ncbi:MAG: tripartite tricarboxylate transporter substrate binding protein [Betaproteobacteria bacterium]|nr:tripartite tricarboxylate transporter substrate binding protein [Betaproteobacteria bacterium]
MFALLPALLAAPVLAQAQAFPSRPITVVVPYLPGGTNDIIVRTLTPKLTEALGQAVVIENRPGAGGNLGAAYVAKARPDGHTLMIASVGVFAINKWMAKESGFDPDKDLVPVVNTGSVPNMLLVHPSVPVSSVKDLVALAKAKPNTINFASMGSGSTGHLCGEMFKMAVQVQATHIAYKGSAPALQDLLAGTVQMMFDNLPTALPRAKNGQLKGLAVTSAKRNSLAPEIPTMEEAGVPGYEATAWFGVAAPAGTPKAVVDRLNMEFVKALRDPQNAQKLEALGLAMATDSPEGFAAFIAAESQKWRKVVIASGAKAD